MMVDLQGATKRVTKGGSGESEAGYTHRLLTIVVRKGSRVLSRLVKRESPVSLGGDVTGGRKFTIGN